MRLKYKLLLLALVPLCFLLFFSIRTTLDKTRQAQQMAALAQPMAQAAQGAKALSETNVTDVNALTRLLTGAT